MSSSHDPGADLLIPADTPVHRLAPQCKVAATALFVLAVACTPRPVFWPYAWYGLLLAAVVLLAQLPPLTLLRRLVVEVPFLLFVLALPFLGQAPYVDVAGVDLSVVGLTAAASIALKASFGLLATGVLAATTPLPEIITGLERLRVPRLFTAVAAFMVRYTEVLLSELARLRTARACRGGDTRWVWQARDVATSIGALFVRSFERGERVYLAMASRGYTGALPDVLTGSAAARRAWVTALTVPLLAALATVGAVAL
ncbi:MAG: cobalt ECF transporter T component CbiQ [Pseudonocardiaceae bacterium]|nr:cobalt ECF transporter T component CbiQ [Pseudonocardiaceae bacterium]